MTALALRVWRGWRSSRLQGPDGWSAFVAGLGETFVPATWRVMGRYGLRCYVPSLLTEDKHEGMPDETALLFYESQQSYDASKKTVAGRSYSVMHQALFNFSAPAPVSSSGWAAAHGTALDPGKAWATQWRQPETEAACSFRSMDAAALFVALAHDDAKMRAPADVFDAMGMASSEAVVHTEPGFTLGWIAVPASENPLHIVQNLSSGLAGTQLQTWHVARTHPVPAAYFEPDAGVVFNPDETLRFLG